MVPYIHVVRVRMIPSPANVPSSDENECREEAKVHMDWMAQYLNELLVSTQYSRVFGSPPKCEWRGRDGAPKLISRIFPEMSLTLIKQAIRETFDCESKGELKKGNRKERKCKGTYMISCKSVYERMVCDLLERELCIHHTTLLITMELKKDRLQEVSALCVRDIYVVSYNYSYS